MLQDELNALANTATDIVIEIDGTKFVLPVKIIKHDDDCDFDAVYGFIRIPAGDILRLATKEDAIERDKRFYAMCGRLHDCPEPLRYVVNYYDDCGLSPSIGLLSGDMNPMSKVGIKYLFKKNSNL